MSVEKGASGNTVAAYKNDLQQFDRYIIGINGNGKARDWETLERDLIIDYLLTLRSRNYAEATVARKVAAIKSFFQYMQAEGTIHGNPAESLESPRVGRSLPKPLSVTEVDELLEQTDEAHDAGGEARPRDARAAVRHRTSRHRAGVARRR